MYGSLPCIGLTPEDLSVCTLPCLEAAGLLLGCTGVTYPGGVLAAGDSAGPHWPFKLPLLVSARELALGSVLLGLKSEEPEGATSLSMACQ